VQKTGTKVCKKMKVGKRQVTVSVPLGHQYRTSPRPLPYTRHRSTDQRQTRWRSQEYIQEHQTPGIMVLAASVASPSCHDCRSETPMVKERLKSCSTDLGGTGNKYDAGRCGISDGTLGNASKMSRSKGVSFLDDGEMASSEPGASGMMGGSMGDCSGITSSRCSIADQLTCNKGTTRGSSPGSSNIDLVFVALLRRRPAKELALATLRRGERRKDPWALSLFPLLLLRIENMLRMLIESLPC
jgi:hypothetical protein